MKKNSKEKESEGKVENLAYMNKSQMCWQIFAAVASGMLLSLSFPPIGCSYLAWFAMMPMLIVPMPKERWMRIFCGYVFGYTHFAQMLHWINEVGFGAGWLLSIYCALFPMMWYLIASAWFKRIALRNEHQPTVGFLHLSHLRRGCISGLMLASFWVALEWIRGWFLTGFPWGYLGISQYTHPNIVRLSSFTGVFGISFLIVLFNCTFAAEICRAFHVFKLGGKLCQAWHFIIMGICACLAIVPLFVRIPDAPEDAPMLKIGAIQGNIPQCREWTQEEYQFAENTYCDLTRKACSKYDDLDLVLWPECAVPASIDYQPYRAALITLQGETKVPLLLGALQNRLPSINADISEARSFNSAFLLDEKAHIVAGYDKMHRVPFGEYVPLGDMMPWLRDIIGMGRDLTPGTTPFVFALPKGARAGVNICFEDAFPEISREFTRKGANLLMTITNDSWYNHSCGAEQHAAHVIFRAAENRRPFMRSGNNSHTLMVTPAGKAMGQLVSPESIFARDFMAYEMPVSNEWGTTFYTRYGDVFAYLCLAITGAAFLWMLITSFQHHKKMMDK